MRVIIEMVCLQCCKDAKREILSQLARQDARLGARIGCLLKPGLPTDSLLPNPLRWSQ